EWHWSLFGCELDRDACADLCGPPPARKSERKPHHVEANGNVSAKSKDMTVHDTSRLVVWFKDPPAPPPQPEKPPTTEPQAPQPPATPQPAPQQPLRPPVPLMQPQPQPQQPTPPTPVVETMDGRAKPGPMAPAANAKAAAPEETPPRPIDLSARSVEAWVFR